VLLSHMGLEGSFIAIGFAAVGHLAGELPFDLVRTSSLSRFVFLSLLFFLFRCIGCCFFIVVVVVVICI